MLVGILGGSRGCPWMGTGAPVGGVVDLTRAEKGDDALTMLGSAISPGSTAIIADVAEPAIEVVGEMAKLPGEVIRRPEDDVMEATEAAAKEARRKMREQRKAEVSEKFSERVGKLKDRLGIFENRTERLAVMPMQHR